MAKINIEIQKTQGSNDYHEYTVISHIDASISEVMVGISMTLRSIEDKLPEDEKQEFRRDFLHVLNVTRNGEYNAK